ncbi:hypothetical protein G5V59_00250 [Nocardioides sp. W3-2-3]|uniref:hypothetical protein n=1 Tax=Nocardioides convexus TaxID=2712224 RepID=UPI00241822FB|nr:hypothetical protein [Nocardioides convexus]NGZ99404.1 hypothetical protein [Nocardioides convexus]
MSLVETSVLDTLRTQAAQGAQARQQQADRAPRPHDQRRHHRRQDPRLPQGALRGHVGRRRHGHRAGSSPRLAPGLVPVNEVGHDTPPAESVTAGVSDDALDTFAAGLGLKKEDLRV